MKFQDVYNFFQSYTPIPEAEWLKLEELFKAKQAKKGEVLLQEGKLADTIYFIHSGLLRIYYINKESREFTKVFREKFDLAAPYPEILEGKLTQTCIEAMEYSSLLCLSFKEYQKLSEEHKCWGELKNRLTEEHYLLKAKREFELLTLTSYERYQNFLEDHGEIVNKIPHYQIASYIGITPVNFSKMLSKKNKF